MRAFLHSTTLATPLILLVLTAVLLNNSFTLPWVVTLAGLIVSGVTVLLVRPGLQKIVAHPLTGLGLIAAGTLLVISTPLLGYQQVVATAASSETGTLTSQIPWLMVGGIVVLACLSLAVTARRMTQLPQVLTPMYLVAGEILFLMILEGHWFRWVVAVIFALLLLVTLEDLYLAFHEPSRHQAYAPVNISVYMGLVAYFLFAASLFWLMIFFDFPLWLAALVQAGITMLLAYQALWAIGCLPPRGLLFLLVMPLLSIELFWAISFLPTSVYVDAVILSVGYYLASGIGRNYFLGMLNRKVIVRYFVTSFICSALVILTAKLY
ncbi:MAG: hypothetical protein PHI63_04200 [Patescibacteria group bacterium]|nr:hypothetical protein [Patescibacteria group bacterium]